MFTVSQMSLDIKREEIAKLEQKASQKEEALKKSELMLEEDAIRFDAFLKENDQRKLMLGASLLSHTRLTYSCRAFRGTRCAQESRGAS